MGSGLAARVEMNRLGRVRLWAGGIPCFGLQSVGKGAGVDCQVPRGPVHG